MRAFDWSKTSLGVPEQWPPHLRNAINTIFTSRFPMYIWYGPEQINIYNDAYAPISGSRGHPHLFGRPAIEMWPEIWTTMSAFLREVYAQKTAVYQENLPLELLRNGFRETGYFSFSFNPLLDEQGEPVGAMCIVQETTATVRANQQLGYEKQKLQTFLMQAPVPMCMLEGPDYFFTLANARYEELVGRQVVNRRVCEIFSGEEVGTFLPLLDEVYRTGKAVIGREAPFSPVDAKGKKRDRYLDFGYHPFFDIQGQITGIIAVAVDVTDHVAARKAVEENASLLNAICNTSPDFIFAKDRDGRFTFVNPVIAATLGKAESEILSRTDIDVLGEEFGRPIMENDQRVMSSGQPQTVEETLLAASVKRVYVSNKVPFRDAGGGIIGTIGISRDVTDLRRAQAELETEADKNKKLLHNMPVPFFAVNSDWILHHFNPEAETVLSLKAKDVIGRSLWDVFPGLVGSSFGEVYERAMREGLRFRTEDYYPDFDRWYEVWAYPYSDGMAVSFFDVSDRKRTQQRLESSELRYRTLTESLPQLVWTCLPDGSADYLSKQWVSYTGIPESEQHGYAWLEKVIHPQDRERTLAHWLGAVSGHHDYDIEYRIRRHDGAYRWFKARGAPMRGANGEIAFWLGTCTDVQDQISLAEELKRAKIAAENANELKSSFLANMSHEIRTPLGAMLGFADLLRDPQLSPSERENYSNILMRNGEQLSVIINDILDLSKVEAGELRLEKIPCDVEEIVRDVITLFFVKAKEKQVRLQFAPFETGSGLFLSDPVRVRQVLTNLVGNAVKFTPSGSVTISASVHPRADGSREISFDVRDTGIGIPADQQARVFETFVQADGSITRNFGGTGLGLALSRRLARLLGGDVSLLRSAPGEGTTFCFTVVSEGVEVAARQTTTLVEPVALPLTKDLLGGLRVLIVDDAADNRHLLLRYISSCGAAVDLAENGLEGIEKATRDDFDVVLLDLQMPVMDGFTAIDKLRADGYNKPVIALTAHAMSEVKAKCLAVGFTDHLTKPINKAVLIQKIHRHSKISFARRQ